MGGCVTRRSIRSRSWYFSHKAVTVQGGYGAVFAVRVQVLLSITRVAVQFLSEPENCQGTGYLLGALAQRRGTGCLAARNLSRCRIYIACRCACPGARTITNLSREQEQKQKLWRTTYPYCPCYRLPLLIILFWIYSFVLSDFKYLFKNRGK